MESKSTTNQPTIEQMIISVGSFLYNADSCITEIDSQFLKDLVMLVEAELERREAQLH
tara:strand:+ start:124 stop:297 length:174 start_codon:yes stop_codon:yes gene_type:complete